MDEQITTPKYQKELTKLNELTMKVKGEIHQVIVGQDHMIDLVVTAILTNGHILLEGVPGIAKTLAARLMAKTMSVDFARIQFTPDLMPADIIGTSVFNMKTSEFNFKKGPIFSNVILIDEINRAPAKTQAALFEVMEERQITADGKTYEMEFPFLTLATQNPIEQEGTYRLPEAQLDRFLFRVKMEYPSLEEEQSILKRFNEDFDLNQKQKIKPVFSVKEIQQAQELVEKIHIKDELLNYIAEIVHQTRNNGDLFLGASPRASLAIMKSAKAYAAMSGRDFVTPDDIQFMTGPVLNHRIILSPEKEMEGIEVEDVIREIIQKLEVPR
jgi:MoxR-like ATPase